MGIISGPRSFPVRDHLRSWDHLRTRTALISRKCSLIQVQPYSIAEKGKEETEGHNIDELYEFSNDSTRSTVERIEENSNDVSRCLFIRIRYTYNTAMTK